MFSNFYVLHCSRNQQSKKTDYQGDLGVFFFLVDFEKKEDEHNAADANKKQV